MLNIFTDNLLFIIIGLSFIIIIIVSYFLMIRPSSYVKNDDKKEEKIAAEPLRGDLAIDKIAITEHENLVKEDLEELEVAKEEAEESFEEKVTQASQEDEVDLDDKILTADALLKDRNVEKTASNHSMSQPLTLSDAEEEKAKKSIEQQQADTNENDLGKYHILYRIKDKKWYVKRENASRIIRVLHTKREAVAYATIKAINQDTNIVIHGKDGKIEKHGY